jgi:hypothetical protein
MTGREKSPPPTPANSPRATKSGKCTLGTECARQSLSISLPMANLSKILDETVKHRAVAKHTEMYHDSTECNAKCVNIIVRLDEPPRNSSTGRRYERRFSSSQNMIEEVVRKSE